MVQAMPPDEEHLARAQPREDGLESYRRLIELQKQMIQLSQQHEQAKRDCAALREQVALEIARRLRSRPTLSRRLQDATAKLLKYRPGFSSAEIKLSSFPNNKEASSC